MIMTYNLLHSHLDIDESLFLQDFGMQPEVTLLSCLTHLLKRGEMEVFLNV